MHHLARVVASVLAAGVAGQHVIKLCRRPYRHCTKLSVPWPPTVAVVAAAAAVPPAVATAGIPPGLPNAEGAAATPSVSEQDTAGTKRPADGGATSAAGGILEVLLLPVDPQQCERALQAIVPQLWRAGLLGLDCEWQPEGEPVVPPAAAQLMTRAEQGAQTAVLEEAAVAGPAGGTGAGTSGAGGTAVGGTAADEFDESVYAGRKSAGSTGASWKGEGGTGAGGSHAGETKAGETCASGTAAGGAGAVEAAERVDACGADAGAAATSVALRQVVHAAGSRGPSATCDSAASGGTAASGCTAASGGTAPSSNGHATPSAAPAAAASEPTRATSRSNPVSVLQISSRNLCIILRPAALGVPLPPTLVALLEDRLVLKAGVGIANDAARLRHDYGVIIGGALDVRAVLRQACPAHIGQYGSSLQALSASLLGLKVDKAMQCSNWGDEQLSQAQISYAALDAWLSRRLAISALHATSSSSNGSSILHLLPAGLAKHRRDTVQPAGALRRCADEAADCPAPDTLSWLSQFVGVPWNSAGARASGGRSAATAYATAAGSNSNRSRSRAVAGLAGAGGIGEGDAAASAVAPRSSSGSSSTMARLPTRKTVLYENCRLLAPDGEVLCTCGRKKVLWYLQRGLATLVEGGVDAPSEPLTVQLRFDPAGRGHADDEYYLADKENRCCVCGRGEREGAPYLRHNIIPHCYRRHFPLAFKSHLSHDIILMCPTCHQVCNQHDHQRMASLGEQHGAPLKHDALKYRHDNSRQAVRNAGRALLTNSAAIPAQRRAELQAVVLQHFGGAVVDEAMVQAAAVLETKIEEGAWESHAERVVQGLSEEQLRDFVVGWRRHFVETMRPQHLPPHWSVDSRVQNSSMVRGKGARPEVEDSTPCSLGCQD